MITDSFVSSQEDEHVRETAVVALSKIGLRIADALDDLEILKYFASYLDSANPRLRESTCSILGNISVDGSSPLALLGVAPYVQIVSLLRWAHFLFSAFNSNTNPARVEQGRHQERPTEGIVRPLKNGLLVPRRTSRHRRKDPGICSRYSGFVRRPSPRMDVRDAGEPRIPRAHFGSESR